ncbi:MAG: SsrA-binding protein SmpB [Candidatus Latescibacterota bacterium]
MADGIKIIVQNRKARHDYDIIDTYEAGLVLHGTEVKALREGRANLKDSYARVEGNEAFLHKIHISEYLQANRFNHEPERKRKLLLHKKEIDRLRIRAEEKGLTLIPLKMYFKRGKAKVELGVARGKKQYDKRHDIAKRDSQRALDQALKSRTQSGR